MEDELWERGPVGTGTREGNGAMVFIRVQNMHAWKCHNPLFYTTNMHQ